MALGSLVAIPELQQEGPARLEEQTPGFLKLRFLASGAEMTTEARNVVRYCLFPGTKIVFNHGQAEAGGIIAADKPGNAAGGLLSYPVDVAGKRLEVAEDQIVAIPAPGSAGEQLRTVAFHELQPRFARAGTPRPPYPWGPSTFCAREALQQWRDEAWSATGGVIGLAGSRVRPLPHQLLTARRILADRQVRFLLADEVGLGKTIEAGLVMQSLLAMNPRLRVLVVVPGALVSQWFVELYVKFGGRRFLMLDADRLEEESGNPWRHQFVISSSRAIEGLSGKGAIQFTAQQWDLVIVDECHRMQPGGILYRHVERLSKRSPHVLLLSATPGRQHADAYLALLHLLQPEAYRADDSDGFAAKLAAADQVAELLRDSRDGDEAERKVLAKRWVKTLGKDAALASRLKAWINDASAFELLATYVCEHYQLDHRVIRNRRKVLARLSRATGVAGLDLAERTLHWVDYKPDAAEQAVREALATYREALTVRFTDDDPPARLAHWLLQCELAAAAEPKLLDRLLAMRSAVLDDPDDFAAYRDHAGDDVLAQVLRSDLSDAETTTHIARSAASNVEEPGEPEALATLREAVAAWTKKKVPARDKACIKALGKFWDEFPEEKVLVFTTHAMAVEPLANRLRNEFGDAAVATFGAHRDSPEREEAARKFRDDNTCHVLVCDPLGGEGRNFQFVSMVLHHDLPWSLAAVEQRIGRVDRLGRDGEVPSWVLRPVHDLAVDGAWATLLDAVVGVFTSSSSGLEFVSSEFECQAAVMAARGGAPALHAATDYFTELVGAERGERDHLEDELYQASEASFAEAAELARRVENAPPPVDGVCRWLLGMGGGVRRDEEEPRAFHLRPRVADKPSGGVFERAAALRNEHLSFFGLGHQLVDECIDDAQAAGWCAATAWRRAPRGGVKNWEGLRVAFELGLDLGKMAAAELPLEALRRVFTVCPPRRVLRFIRVDGTIETDQAVLSALRPRFDARKGDSALSPKTSRETWMRPLLGGKHEQVLGWQGRVDTAYAAAERLCAGLLEQERDDALTALEPALQAQAKLLATQYASARHRLGNAHPDVDRVAEEAMQEKILTDALLAAVQGAELRIASAAYLIVG
ncbi:MAG: helicase-related protein [Planctomycetota bacterium]|jgi:ATP-dependent helicase HepA|nr:helicase-related protein [Planctomycetota bacterium]